MSRLKGWPVPLSIVDMAWGTIPHRRSKWLSRSAHGHRAARTLT
ncbi:hypothetical protein [Rhizobium sp.]